MMRSPLSRLSLKALRTFEITVRTGSLTRTAAELGTSLSAASRLVRGLEEELDLELLRKDGRGLRPTAAGEALARGLTTGFAEIERAVAAARARRPGREVVLSTLPTFAMRWLIPRLGDFERQHPGIAVRVEATVAVADLGSGQAQAAVRFGRGEWPGLVAHHLFDERLVVVGAPGLVQSDRHGRQRSESWRAADLVSRFPLLTSKPRPQDWPAWFRAAGVDPALYMPGHQFEAQTYVVEAVLAGRGLGLIDKSLIGIELAGGGLVRLSDVAISGRGSHWFVRPAAVEPTPELAAFEHWIRAAAAGPARNFRRPAPHRMMPMPSKEHFQTFARYNRWANGRLYDAAASLSDEEYRRDRGAFFKSMHGTLNHLLVADRIWLQRITGDGDPVQPPLNSILHEDLASLRAARETEDSRIINWIDSRDEAAYAGTFTYRNSSGKAFTDPLSIILTHFFNHETHHRGQAHAILTGLGKAAPELDLIYFLRQQ